MGDGPSIANPILNSPFDPPARHFELGAHGPTGIVVDGRRSSESFIPVPRPKKGRGAATRGEVQEDFGLDVTGERQERNPLVNDIRFHVERWRANGYQHAQPISRKLMQHWAATPPVRDEPVFFCQREAAETAIFLAEIAGRHGRPDFRTVLEAANGEHNLGLSRVALKMATGAGKTVVMAMLIAWQTLNKIHSPRDARYSKRFLVVTPGITIRDRLRVLQPSDAGNYYDARGLVPPDLRALLDQAQVLVTNYHAFLPRERKEFQGVASNTKKLLRAGLAKPGARSRFTETDDEVVARVLRDLPGTGEIVVLNDEAHHCYRDKPLDETHADEADAESKARNEEARRWFKGLRAVQRKVGVKTIYDLSATPYYLRGSGWLEGYIFPWVVSDFSLMDAIESGIVKVPRIPVDDDAIGDLPTFLRLWDHVGPQLRPRRGKKAESDLDWEPPKELQGALDSLYRSYSRAFGDYEARLAADGAPPPVFIVVCNTTVVSKLVYDWITGVEVPATDDGAPARLRAGHYPLLSNVGDDGRWLGKPRTILVDSAQLESGESLRADFKSAAAAEIAQFQRQYLLRHPGADGDDITDELILREVMNTVGKRGELGESVRCVVSVSMLTEGWDANTVTHILGVRAFRSQLLCEQVVGRGLRRRSYAVNDDGCFDPEYAEVYGVPFAFIPTDKVLPPAEPKEAPKEVRALPERAHLRITFPKVDGYRLELPDEHVVFDFDDPPEYRLARDTVPTITEVQGIAGPSAVDVADDRPVRDQEIAFKLAERLVKRFSATDPAGGHPAWLFPELLVLTRRWIAECVTADDGVPRRRLLDTDALAAMVDALWPIPIAGSGRPHHLVPVLRSIDPEGSTDDVGRFFTRKAVIDTVKSHVDRVVLDGAGGGNTWEQIVALELERHPDVAAYVKNDRLYFEIPYVYRGRSHRYVPDFLARLVRRGGPAGPDVERTLIIEVSGGQKQIHSPGPTALKADTARRQWCPAVNHHGGFGRWGYIEITSMVDVKPALDAAIAGLYADGPVTGEYD